MLRNALGIVMTPATKKQASKSTASLRSSLLRRCYKSTFCATSWQRWHQKIKMPTFDTHRPLVQKSSPHSPPHTQSSVRWLEVDEEANEFACHFGRQRSSVSHESPLVNSVLDSCAIGDCYAFTPRLDKFRLRHVIRAADCVQVVGS